MNDTIFALSTPMISAGVAVIRISGEKASEAIKAFNIETLPEARFATFTKLLDEKKSLIDEAICIWFPSPNSFNGENVLELQTHGSIAVIKKILQTLDKIPGFRMANPGEFTERSVRNNKISLLKAEAIIDLINAETSEQLKQATEQMEGKSSIVYKQWYQDIIKLISFAEAIIDFPDDDIPESLIQEITKNTESLKDKIQKYLNNNLGETVKSGWKVTFLGTPNTGKSTLINSITNKQIAITSDIAGTTRDIISQGIIYKGHLITFSDTAGINKKTNDPIEIEGIKRSIKNINEADVKVVVLDGMLLPEIDSSVLPFIDNDTICIFNKSENYNGHFIKQGNISGIAISALYGKNIDLLMEEIYKKIILKFDSCKDNTITNTRHRQHIVNAYKSLEMFDISNMGIEINAEHLKNAAKEIAKINCAIYNNDQALDEIFSNFCIGK